MITFKQFIDEAVLKKFAGNKDMRGAGPQWKFDEIAEKLGFTHHEFMAFVKKVGGFPAPTGKRNQTSTISQASYYDLNEVKKWWASVKDQRT